ncbi:centrosomal protein of 164 kDa isoform X2 [Atheta coriaria]|uniref:centrosomal protein of 164 kDa isoform X2 n=1 Tax=Dalotia coriaria TaxID=877792 RepID=UPI0031F448FB
MSSANSIVCEEIFDEGSTPSAEEIKAYATKLGIDPDNEPQLLSLAAEGLMKALPPGWKPVLDDKSKSYYYYNNVTGKTQWEHPLDDIYRGLVKKKRSESQSHSIGEPNEDATTLRDDMPSLEEPPFASLGARRKEPKLSPLNHGAKILRQKSEEKPIAAFVQNRKIGLSLSTSFDGKPDKLQESPKKDFKLSGGGSMFLKKAKTPSIEMLNIDDDKTEDIIPENFPESSKPEEKEKEEEIIKEKDEIAKDDPKETPKSILRERSFVIESSKTEEDDERKNVRFSLDVDSALKSPANDVILPISSLKIIKANPKDFPKPRNRSDPEISMGISDSEDDSIMKSLDKKVSKKSELNMQDEEEEIHHNIAEKFREDNEIILNKIRDNADKELEDMKKTIWDETNIEISRYRQELHESQKDELERILTTEKLNYEANIKRELDNLRIEMESRNLGALKQERLKLEEELSGAKEGLVSEREKAFEEKIKALEKNYAIKYEEIEKELSRDLEKRKDELIVSHNAILDQMRKQHQAVLDEIKLDFKSEEKILRREHESMLAELKRKVNGGNLDNEMNYQTSSKDKETGDERLYEKVRCEKRLLEDKYRCLKEKYMKLKTDVKLTIEKRHRKREQSLTTTTTGSETEKSNSINKEKSPNRSPTHMKPPLSKPELSSSKLLKPEAKQARTVIIQDLDTSASDRSFKNDGVNYESSEENANFGRGRKKYYSRVKNTPPTRSSLKSKRTPRTCSPVENLRRQLQKLEDLEDQLPLAQHAQADTYHLRHRIHLERDSIKRAKESLRTQKCLFQQRQNDLKLKHGSMARHTLQQLCQEEKDLTDMEVSLHRTRSLLGEKVIRLRHLEQSLQRATAASNEPKTDEATLSDLSSHSASSGISSTEFATAADGMKAAVLRGEHLQESSEIIQSLENLNLEIREIWEVLNQQQKSGNMPSVLPLPLVYPDLGWPMLAGTAAVPAPPSIPTLADRLHNYRQHVALANAQSTVVTHAANQGATTTLVERTRNLRHWLRQAGIDPNTDVTPQATL